MVDRSWRKREFSLFGTMPLVLCSNPDGGSIQWQASSAAAYSSRMHITLKPNGKSLCNWNGLVAEWYLIFHMSITDSCMDNHHNDEEVSRSFTLSDHECTTWSIHASYPEKQFTQLQLQFYSSYSSFLYLFWMLIHPKPKSSLHILPYHTFHPKHSYCVVSSTTLNKWQLVQLHQHCLHIEMYA